MKRRKPLCNSFAFTADRFGRAIQAKITAEALARLSSVIAPRLEPRHVRRMYMEHREEIDRIARLVSEEREDPDSGLVITGEDVQRLRRTRR
ncbi:MAG: hypothetical protein ACLP1D_04190 [Xanthobacteraceae bacterium]